VSSNSGSRYDLTVYDSSVTTGVALCFIQRKHNQNIAQVKGFRELAKYAKQRPDAITV
jgi:hypothetical protein